MGVITSFLKLFKPAPNDYVDVEKHLNENYDKIDAWAKDLVVNDLTTGGADKAGSAEMVKKLGTEKLDKGNVPATLNNAEKIVAALQGNGGLKFDENLLYLNDEGTKRVGYYYLDRLKNGIFECLVETTTTVNDSSKFRDISNKASADRLDNLRSITKFIDEVAGGGTREYIIDNDVDFIFMTFANSSIPSSIRAYDSRMIPANTSLPLENSFVIVGHGMNSNPISVRYTSQNRKLVISGTVSFSVHTITNIID